MTSKERVLTALAHGEPDRAPINYSANPGIDKRLKAHYGLAANDSEGLKGVLGVDFAGVRAPYVGPKLHEDLPDRRVGLWGERTRYVEHDAGGYWDFCDFPLPNATVEEAAAWPMPSPDDFDYSVVAGQCRERQRYCVSAGGAGVGCVINRLAKLRSMEQLLIDMATDNPVGLLLIERKQEIELEVMRRTLEAAEGGVDLFWMGEDLGSQIGPMISPALYRKYIRPWHAEFVQMAKSYNVPVMFHCCGSSSWAFPDFIEIGIDAVETLQPEATDMAPRYLKESFGDRLAFHGCISTAGPVSFGTTDDVVENCREVLEIMMPGGGYCFAPTHSLQDNSPTENVVAMYETAHQHGRY